MLSARTNASATMRASDSGAPLQTKSFTVSSCKYSGLKVGIYLIGPMI